MLRVGNCLEMCIFSFECISSIQMCIFCFTRSRWYNSFPWSSQDVESWVYCVNHSDLSACPPDRSPSDSSLLALPHRSCSSRSKWNSFLNFVKSHGKICPFDREEEAEAVLRTAPNSCTDHCMPFKSFQYLVCLHVSLALLTFFHAEMLRPWSLWCMLQDMGQDCNETPSDSVSSLFLRLVMIKNHLLVVHKDKIQSLITPEYFLPETSQHVACLRGYCQGLLSTHNTYEDNATESWEWKSRRDDFALRQWSQNCWFIHLIVVTVIVIVIVICIVIIVTIVSFSTSSDISIIMNSAVGRMYGVKCIQMI